MPHPVLNACRFSIAVFSCAAFLLFPQSSRAADKASLASNKASLASHKIWADSWALQLYDSKQTSPNGLDTQHPFSRIALLGTISDVKKKTDSASATARIKIEQVFYGYHQADEVTVEMENPSLREGRYIFFLSSAFDRGANGFRVAAVMDESELPGMKALCGLLFDSMVLNAEFIFVGGEVSPSHTISKKIPAPPGEPFRQTVKVVLRVSGGQVREGANVTAVIDSGFPSDERPEKTSLGQRLYLAYEDPWNPQHDVSGTSLSLLPLPVEMEPLVLDSLKRRDSFQVIDDDVDPTHPRKYREILFHGSMDEAISLLDSGDFQVLFMAKRYFVRNIDAARKALIAKIKEGISASGPAQGREYARQQMLIYLLVDLERISSTGAIPDLVEHLITKIENDPAQLPMPARDDKKQTRPTRDGSGEEAIPEEERTDINNTLAWLVMVMDEEQVRQRWGARLEALRGKLGGWWLYQVSLAMIVVRIDQVHELERLQKRMEGVTPVVFKPSYLRNEKLVGAVISRDGKYLAIDNQSGISIISAVDSATIARIDSSGHSCFFSPDGTYLYVGSGSGLLLRYDWRAGKPDKEYKLDDKKIVDLSTDGGTIFATSPSPEDVLFLMDVETGKFVRKMQVFSSANFTPALSPDGRLVAHARNDWRLVKNPKGGMPDRPAETDIIVEALDGKSKARRLHCNFMVESVAFTPDGHHLLCAGYRGFWANFCMAMVDLAPQGKGVSPVAVTEKSDQFAIFPGGKYVAVAAFDTIVIRELPSLKEVRSIKLPVAASASGMAISPDEKMLYCGDGGPAIRVISLETFAEVFPYAGHPGYLLDAFFSADGKRLTTFGDDGSICRWNATTLEMTGRIPAPRDFQLFGISPGGNHALYAQPAPLLGDSDSPSAPRKILVLDSATGRETFRSDLGLSIGDRIFWLPGGELLALVDERPGEKITRIDYLQGRILDQATDPEFTTIERFYLADDRRSLLTHSRKEGGYSLLDLASGKKSEVIASTDGSKMTVGEKSFSRLDAFPAWRKTNYHLRGMENVMDYHTDWKDPRFPLLRGMDDDQIGYSADGKKLFRIVEDDRDHAKTSNPPKLLLVYEVATMKPLFAIPIKVGACANFNADARRLVIAAYDGTLEIRPLPGN